MDLNIKPLRCFVAVAEGRSFTAAAQRLHISQPALSGQIRELEKLLGFNLFHRSTRRVDLTATGTELLSAARRMIEENDRLIRTIKSLQRMNQLRLSLGAVFYTIDFELRNRLLEAYVARSPQVQIYVNSRPQSELLDALHAGELDLTFLLAAPVSRTHYDQTVRENNRREFIYPDDLETLVLQSEPIQLLVPVESPLTNFSEIPLAALDGQRVVGFSASYGSPLIDPIHTLLRSNGAELVQAPDHSGLGMERFGKQMRLPVVSLGWFKDNVQTRSDMVLRPVAGLGARTNYVLAKSKEPLSDAARVFWEIAQNITELPE